MNSERSTSARKKKAGFLTYCLEEFTADCISRISERLETESEVILTAYPVMDRLSLQDIHFRYIPSTNPGRFFSVRKKGSTPEGLPLTINWRAAWRCVWDNDVVVLFGIQGGSALLATFFSVLLWRPLIAVSQTLSPTWEKKRRWWLRWLKGWILRRCEIQVIQTPNTKATLTQVYGLDERTFVEAPFEAGATRFLQRHKIVGDAGRRSEQRNKWGLGSTPCFLFVGTLLRFKGIFTLIDAAVLLKRRGANFNVLIVGPDPKQPNEPRGEDLKSLVARNGLADNVTIFGKMDLEQLATLYSAVDVFVLPTQRDMWPKVLVEAAIFSLPLITTEACGASGSLVEDGKTGFVVPPDDAQALAGAMEKLLDSRLRKEFGTAAFDFCKRFSDQEAETEGYIDAIRRVLQC